jgi:hypothetical protein
MRIAVEMLCGEFVQLNPLERLHLVYQTWRYIHALARDHFKFFEFQRLRVLLHTYLEPSRPQIKRFSFEAMIMERAALALIDFEDLATIERAVDDPDLSTPAFWHNSDGWPGPTSRISDLVYAASRPSAFTHFHK